MTAVIVEIMVKVIMILGIATRKHNVNNRVSQSHLDLQSFFDTSRKIFEVAHGKHGDRGRTPGIGQVDTGRGSDGVRRASEGHARRR